ncbi:MAG: XRE family aerobic/anaerobic benzoate catabolism transcriptional regulator [Gammaproteobacteria bacterium]|jgi:XRE family aerobic/anaerobic benzoate catabolism transcriptional regulator
MLYTALMMTTDDSSSRSQADDYLQAIGARVRTLRSRRGMSRRILAEGSGVSERYLAQLESGTGNISILRLRDVAQAIDVALEDLVATRAVTSPTYDYLAHYIRDADPIELAKLHEHVVERHRVQPRLIALIGLRGAGKSTLGAALADRLALPFTELVKSIEARAGIELNEIFSLGGQSTYRRLERECLDEIIDRREWGVLAVGGSLVSEPGSYERLLGSCVTICLRAAPEDHMNRVIAQGDERPMADNPRAMDDLKRILLERESLSERSHYTVETSGRSVTDTLDELVRLPGVANIAEQRESLTNE